MTTIYRIVAYREIRPGSNDGRLTRVASYNVKARDIIEAYAVARDKMRHTNFHLVDQLRWFDQTFTYHSRGVEIVIPKVAGE